MKKQTQPAPAPKAPGALGMIGRRLKEPSTYAGIAVLASLFGVKEAQAFTTPEAAAALAAIAAMVLPGES